LAYIPNSGCSDENNNSNTNKSSSLSHHTFTIIDCRNQVSTRNEMKLKKKHSFTYEACNAREKQLWQTSIITCMLSYTAMASKVKREKDKQNTFHLLPLSKKFSLSTENNNNRNKCSSSSSFFASFKFPSSHHVYECDLHDPHKRHHQSNISSSSMLRKTITSKKL
jgi:hypothetical protein